MDPARPIPDFLIVGAPRCGTTFMFRYLDQHPQIVMSEIKEPQHFATDLDSGSELDARVFVRDRDRYRALFSHAQPDQLTGDASTWHLYSKAAAANIKAANPQARIIIQLRDPVEMLYSLHERRVFTGSEDLTDFAAALAAEDDRRRGRLIPPNARIVPALFYRDIGRYAKQVERYLEQFGRLAVHVIVFEEFRADPAQAYRQTLEFLGVDAGFVPEFRLVNAAAVRRSQRLHVAVRSGAVGRLSHRLVPTRVRWEIRRRLDRLNSRLTERPPLDPALAGRLRDELRADVARLSELLDRDFAALWWSRDPAERDPAERDPAERDPAERD